MCVLMPIVITIVFIAINMMFMQINRAAARGEAYAITYNKESYIAGQAGTGDEILEQQIFQSLSEYMNNLDELDKNLNRDLYANFQANIDFTPYLKWTTSYSFGYSTTRNDYFIPSYSNDG